jgi:hypothetical protein
MTGPEAPPAVFDIEVVLARRAAMPYRVPGVADVERAQEIVEGILAAWGIPLPEVLWGPKVPRLMDCVAEAGEYRAETPDCLIIVKRSS